MIGFTKARPGETQDCRAVLRVKWRIVVSRACQRVPAGPRRGKYASAVVGGGLHQWLPGQPQSRALDSWSHSHTALCAGGSSCWAHLSDEARPLLSCPALPVAWEQLPKQMDGISGQQ